MDKIILFRKISGLLFCLFIPLMYLYSTFYPITLPGLLAFFIFYSATLGGFFSAFDVLPWQLLSKDFRPLSLILIGIALLLSMGYSLYAGFFLNASPLFGIVVAGLFLTACITKFVVESYSFSR